MENLQGISIKVSFAVLARQAKSVLDRIGVIKTKFDNMESYVNQSANYWEGSASDTHRRVYRQYKDEIEEALRRFQDSAQLLETIAQNYLDQETAAGSEASGLPSEIIE